MTTKTHADSLFEQVFDWVLDTGRESLPPERIYTLMSTQSLTAAESCMLVCFLQAIEHADASRRDRVARMCALLAVPEVFRQHAGRRVGEVVARMSPRPRPEELVEAPPAELTEVIQGLVLSFVRHHCVPRRRLEGLTAAVFQHPQDREMLAALKAIPLMGRLTGAVLNFTTRTRELQLLANSIEVTPESLPRLHAVYAEACHNLDVAEPPPLFVCPGAMNAYCVGADRPLLQVASSLVNVLTPEEQLFVLGHELGHAISGHVKYHTLAHALSQSSSGILSHATLGLSQVAAKATVEPALYAWMRRSELTADRAGFLACQNREAALRAMLKLSGFPIMHAGDLKTSTLVEQARRYEQAMERSGIDRLHSLNNYWSATHPFMIARAAELIGWIESHEADDILASSPERLARREAAVRDDPRKDSWTRQIVSGLTAWAARHTGRPEPELRPLLLRLVEQREPPSGAGWDGLLCIELHVTQPVVDRLEYAAHVVMAENGEAACYEVPLAISDSWEDAPKELRRQWLAQAEDRMVIPVYSAAANSIPDGAR